MEQLGETCDKAGLVMLATRMLATRAQLAFEKLKEARHTAGPTQGSDPLSLSLALSPSPPSLVLGALLLPWLRPCCRTSPHPSHSP